MKKTVAIAVVLLLLLTACQPVPGTDDGTANSIPTGSTTSSTGAESPTSTPTTSVPDTSVPETNPPTTSTPAITPNAGTGYALIHKKHYSSYWVEYDLSDCIIGYLYWLDKETHEVTLLLAERLRKCIEEDVYVYYVKEAEPTKIYRLLIADPSQQELVHETAHGKVCDMTIYPGIENYLQFVADNKKFVVLELDTSEETVLMEQYYIEIADMGPGDDGTLGNLIWFLGKLTGEEPFNSSYFYYRDTGETKEDPYL